MIRIRAGMSMEPPPIISMPITLTRLIAAAIDAAVISRARETSVRRSAG